MVMAVVGYSLALSRAEVLAHDGADPAAARRRAERAWRRLPEVQLVAVLSGVATGDGMIAVIQDADTLRATEGAGDNRVAEGPRARLSSYTVLGISVRSAETVVLQLLAADALAALARAQFGGFGHPGVHLVAALGGTDVMVHFTLETLPWKRGA